MFSTSLYLKTIHPNIKNFILYITFICFSKSNLCSILHLLYKSIENYLIRETIMKGELIEMTEFLINLTEKKPYTFITICILIIVILMYNEIQKKRHSKN